MVYAGKCVCMWLLSCPSEQFFDGGSIMTHVVDFITRGREEDT